MIEKGIRWGLVTALAAAVACSTDGTVAPPDENLCISVRGAGATDGDRNRLMGDGVFTIDGETLTGDVGIYLFEMIPDPNGGFHVDTQYQFNWPNGDSFLTADRVFFAPGLQPDEYRFRVEMTIIAGTGRFRGREGQQPIALNAIITFGDPIEPGGPRSAREEFDVDGELCPL